MNKPTVLPSETSYACLDYRREKLADPRHLSPAAQAHAAQCSLCQAYARRSEAAEIRLTHALTAVDIPEGLNERILLRALAGQPRSLPHWRTWAIAASVLLLSFIGLGLWQQPSPLAGADLAQAAAAHAQDESLELATHRSEAPAQFSTVLASFGGQLQAPLGEVSYIHFCPVDGFGQGWHIIYNTQQGKVTLLLVPAKEGAAVTKTVQIAGKSIKVERAGHGYYAIIADDLPGVESADKALKTRVRWDT